MEQLVQRFCLMHIYTCRRYHVQYISVFVEVFICFLNFFLADIAQRYRISKYPTLKLFRNGMMMKREYRGQRSVTAIADYIRQQKSNPIREVQDLEEINSLDVSVSILFLLNTLLFFFKCWSDQTCIWSTYLLLFFQNVVRAFFKLSGELDHFQYYKNSTTKLFILLLIIWKNHTFYLTSNIPLWKNIHKDASEYWKGRKEITSAQLLTVKWMAPPYLISLGSNDSFW